MAKQNSNQTDDNTVVEPTLAIEQKYFRQEIIDNSEVLFGVPKQAVVGALHDNPAQELTVSEVSQAVKNFMERKVK